MDVTGQNLISVFQNGLGIVGQNDFNFSTLFADQFGVEFQIVNTGEGMEYTTEQFSVLSFSQNVGVGVDTLFIQQIQINQILKSRLQ